MNLQIISAPSILGLKPSGVEKLGEALLACGLQEKLGSIYPVVHVETLNNQYSQNRDAETNCINAKPILEFSGRLNEEVKREIGRKRFAVVLGGDCSILLGIVPALKTIGTYGLLHIDAHADFYLPEQSPTGELADMDLAFVTGHGPDLLTNMDGLKPYVDEKNTIQIGQRDYEQTKEYGSPDIRKTNIKCFSLDDIRLNGIDIVARQVIQHINTLGVDGFWMHFDTDVLADEINPAVDYRLPGGLQFAEVEALLRSLLSTGKISGISISIFNPSLDREGHIAKQITNCLAKAFTNP